MIGTLAETVLVLAVVALALAYLVRRAVGALRGRGGCGCGATTCPAARDLAERIRDAARRVPPG